jgi:RimJ/RimL family protein N-acetyltransferase
MTITFGPSTQAPPVPTLVTPRLLLRAWTSADIPAYTRMAAHPDMSKYTGSPAGEGAVWRMFAFQIGHWALRGYGMWIVEERATGEFLGRAGLYEEYGWPGLEVAWTTRRDRWGEGFATEGGTAALNFAFTELGRERVISIIHPDNTASNRVAEKLGLTVVESTELHGQPRNIWAITNERVATAR